MCLIKHLLMRWTSSFANRDHPNPTTLSTHVWDLKQSNRNFEISWSVIDRANDFDPVTRKCRLCLKEKFHIIFQPAGATLNQRSELYSTCRHRLRQTLANSWAVSLRFLKLMFNMQSYYLKLSLMIVITCIIWNNFVRPYA